MIAFHISVSSHWCKLGLNVWLSIHCILYHRFFKCACTDVCVHRYLHFSQIKGIYGLIKMQIEFLILPVWMDKTWRLRFTGFCTIEQAHSSKDCCSPFLSWSGELACSSTCGFWTSDSFDILSNMSDANTPVFSLVENLNLHKQFACSLNAAILSFWLEYDVIICLSKSLTNWKHSIC